MQEPLSSQNQALKIGDEHVILQERDRKLLEILSLLRIVDRGQAARICGFNSTTRVNERLLKLTRSGILKRFFFISALGSKKALYTLSKRGAEVIGKTANPISHASDSFLIANEFIAHQLAINEVYCAALSGNTNPDEKKVEKWRSFKNPHSQAIPLIPDAYFEVHSKEMVRPVFLEVDLGTEGLPVWSKKVTNYINLAASGEFQRIFGHSRFAVAVVVSSDRRMHSLRRHIAQITPKLFFFTTQDEIDQKGMFAPIWFRPDGDQPQSLI